MNKKGFTLIELLAVIVILAIIALIATPIILNMINEARKSAAKSSTLGYVDSIEAYAGFNQISDETEIKGYDVSLPTMTNKQVTCTKTSAGWDDNCESFMEAVDKKNKGKSPDTATIIIGEDGKVQSGTKMKYNGYEVNYDGNDAHIGGKSSSGGNSSTKYSVYSVGDEVHIKESDWYVIENSGASDSTVKLMAKWNIRKDANASTTLENLFIKSTANDSSNYNFLLAFGNTPVYENSSIKVKLEGDFKDAIEHSLDISINSIGMWGEEDLVALGCTITKDPNSLNPNGAKNITCDTSKPWYNKIFKWTFSWINIPSADYGDAAMRLINDGRIDACQSKSISVGGVRPVITINKSVLQ